MICPQCGSPMRLIACLTDAEPVQRILAHAGEATTPSPISPARSPPLGDCVDGDQLPPTTQNRGEPAPEFEFDQTASW